MHLGQLTVAGEVFTISADPDGGVHYRWDSGPNDGYGFSSRSNRPASVTADEHRRAIRQFLDMIDPVHGFIADRPL